MNMFLEITLKKINIKLKNKIVECNVYIGNKKNIGKEKKPNKSYLDNFFKNNLITRGYKNFLETFC